MRRSRVYALSSYTRCHWWCGLHKKNTVAGGRSSRHACRRSASPKTSVCRSAHWLCAPERASRAIWCMLKHTRRRKPNKPAFREPDGWLGCGRWRGCGLHGVLCGCFALVSNLLQALRTSHWTGARVRITRATRTPRSHLRTVLYYYYYVVLQWVECWAAGRCVYDARIYNIYIWKLARGWELISASCWECESDRVLLFFFFLFCQQRYTVRYGTLRERRWWNNGVRIFL